MTGQTSLGFSLRMRSRLPAGLRAAYPFDASSIAGGVVAVAHVAQGGWCVRCPFCGGSEYGSPTEPLFLCCSCWNEAVGGKLVAVRYPEGVDIGVVALLRRPDGMTRNWLPGEAPADLLRENEEHGL